MKIELPACFLTAKGRFCLLAAACFFVLLLFYGTVHQLLDGWAQEASASAAENRVAWLDVVNFKNAHPDREAYEKQVADHAARSLAMLPGELEQGALLAEIQQLALASHARLKSVLPEPASEERGLLIQPLTVTFSADYFELLDLLRDIRQTERFLKVTGLQVKQGQDGRLDCQLKLQAYALPA